eukprot:TRINITY_DN136_c1_g1_i1.p1 TRINITY_DN136_c1_g1~~TRINITY_DN136_c1_g1_i1.p1  ORF type:complete len:906 (-),score=271.06 TRINITY_DN136_c1_g1_i1:1-2718(-)
MGASQSSAGIKSFPFRAEGAVLNAALYPQGNAIFSISPSVIESFNVQDSNRNWVVYLEGICSSAFDVEQTIIVAGTTEGIVRLIDGKTGKAVKELSTRVEGAKHHAVTTLLSLSDGRLITGNASGKVSVWDVEKGEIVQDLSASQPDVPTCLSCDEAAGRVWVGYRSGLLRHVNLKTGERITDLGARTPTASIPPVVTVKVMHRWNVVVFATANKLMHAWDIAGGKMITTIKFDCISMDYNDTSDFLLTGGTDGTLGLWKFIPGSQPSPLVQVNKWKVHERHVLAVPYVSSVDALIACGSDGFLRLVPHFQENMVPRELRTGKTDASGSGGSGGRGKTKLTDEQVDNLVKELYVEEAPSVGRVDILEYERELFDLVLNALDNGSPESEGRKKVLLQGFTEIEGELMKKLSESKEKVLDVRKQVILRHQTFLNPEETKEKIKVSYETKLAEMKSRHERELKELEEYWESERQRLEGSIAPGRKHAASEYVETLEEVSRDEQKLCDQNVSRMHALLLSSISNRPFHPFLKIICAVNPYTQKVFKALDMKSKCIVAIKMLPPRVPLNDGLRHEGLVPLKEIIKSEKNTYVVMDYYEKNLLDLLRSEEEIPISRVASIVYNLACTLEYLHGLGMVHRDLRPSNILVDGAGKTKLVHMGLMKPLLGHEPKEDGNVFAAPELFGRAILTLSDMWSLGCILVRLLQAPEERKQTLFAGEDFYVFSQSIGRLVHIPNHQFLLEIAHGCNMPEQGIPLFITISREGHRGTLPHAVESLLPKAPPEAIDLIYRLLVFSPRMRIPASRVLGHVFLEKFLPPGPGVAIREPILGVLSKEDREQLLSYGNEEHQYPAESQKTSQDSEKDSGEDAEPEEEAPHGHELVHDGEDDHKEEEEEEEEDVKKKEKEKEKEVKE